MQNKRTAKPYKFNLDWEQEHALHLKRELIRIRRQYADVYTIDGRPSQHEIDTALREAEQMQKEHDRLLVRYDRKNRFNERLCWVLPVLGPLIILTPFVAIVLFLFYF